MLWNSDGWNDRVQKGIFAKAVFLQKKILCRRATNPLTIIFLVLRLESGYDYKKCEGL
jgi:hypothetical protein